MRELSDMAKAKRIEPTAKALREKLGLSRSYASELASGIRKPSLDLALRIEREMGVPASHWVRPPTEQAA